MTPTPPVSAPAPILTLEQRLDRVQIVVSSSESLSTQLAVATIADEATLLVAENKRLAAERERLREALNEVKDHLRIVATMDDTKMRRDRTESLCSQINVLLGDAPVTVSSDVRLIVARLVQHAFLSGVVTARNIPGHEECDGPKLWAAYRPHEADMQRLEAALAADAGEKGDG
ncbi:MAG: hypothetical protein AAF354_07355 [Pseudomonadota bacterium]